MIALLAFVFAATPVVGPAPQVELPMGPVRVEAATLSVSKGRIIEATGGVTVSAPGIRARAEKVRFDRMTNVVDIEGGVSLTLVVDGEEAKLEAESATIDTRTMAGVLREASLEGLGIVVEGKRIEHTASGTFRITEARFTPCNCPKGSKPSWEITATRISARPSGVAILQGGVLRAKGTPIFFMPLGFAPFSSQRATGFLSPQFGSSQSHGLMASLPFYVAVSPWWDLTVEPGLFQSRGPFAAATARVATGGGRAETHVVYHRDRIIKTEPALQNPEDYSENRWYTNARLTHDIAGNWLAKARVELAGDDRYNYDYGPGLLERSRAEYESNVYVERRDGIVGVVAGSTYYQDLRVIGSSSGPYNSAQTVSRLGFADVSAGGLRVAGRSGKGAFADVDASWDFFDNVSSPQGSFRRGGEIEATPRRQGQHVRLRPMLTTPLSLLDDGMRVSAFAAIDADMSSDVIGGDSSVRAVPEAGADLRTEWRRTFAPTADTRVQHRIGPVARWRYVPEVFGDPITTFELPANAPIAGHRVEAGISNRLLYRYKGGAERLPVRELVEIAVLERFRPGDDAPENGETVGNLDLRTGPLRVDADLAIDNRTGNVSSAGGRITTRADAPEGISLEYAYAPSIEVNSHQATGGGWLKLAELTRGKGGIARAVQTLTVQIGARYDFAPHGGFLARSGGITYESPCACWGLRLGATREEDQPDRDRMKIGTMTLPISRFEFSIDLHPPQSVRRFTSSPGGA